VDVGSVETDRLRLERWSHADHAGGLARMNADPEVTRYVGGGVVPRAHSDEMSRRLEAHWDTYGFGLWAAVVKPSDTMIGFVGLSHPMWWPEMIERVEVGWRLARDAWGAGYATEGAREAVRIGFECLALREIVSFVHPDNARSLAVTSRLGMVQEAVVPHPARDELVEIMKLAGPSAPARRSR
jgi:RimJ/RimL family protein N-acetyltransferase